VSIGDPVLWLPIGHIAGKGDKPMEDRDSPRTLRRRHAGRNSATPPPWVADSRAYGAPAPLTPTLSADVTEALVGLWLDYAGVLPTDAHTHIDGNVVTCVMVDGVSDFNIATDRTLDGYKPHGIASTLADYKLEAVSEVTRVTHQRVTSFLSSHDADTDVATETFTLEASLRRGAPRASNSDERA
jgi:hypothetical protein